MLKLAIWQFRYTWKSWFGSLILFSAAGFIMGFSLIGIIATIEANRNYGVYNPVTLFLTPTIFGLITLIVIIKGITHLLINQFKSDYELWTLLGANSKQLAVMIGLQMSLSGIMGGLIGYFCAYPIVTLFYAWIRINPGMTSFPSIHMRIQLDSLILTIISMGVMIGFMGYFSSKKIFSTASIGYKLIKTVTKFIHWCLAICFYGGLIYVYSLFYKNPKSLTKLFGSSSLVTAYMQLLLSLIILMIIVINTLETVMLPLLAKSLPYQFLSNLLSEFSTAYWKVFKKRTFLKSVTLPMVIFSLISSFFMYMVFDLANVSSRSSLSEIFGTLIFFLGAPFLIILANVVSLTIISSSERASSTRQLTIIGYSTTNLLNEKCVEAIIYGLVVFLQGIMCNALLYIPILQTSYYTHTQMRDGWFSIALIPAIAGVLVFLFILAVDGFYILKICLLDKGR